MAAADRAMKIGNLDPWPRPRFWLRPEECIFLVYGTALVVLIISTGEGYLEFLIIAFHSVRPLVLLIVAVGVCIRAYWLAPPAVAGSKALDFGRMRAGFIAAWRVPRDFAPFFLCLITYSTLRSLTPTLRPNLVDDQLIAIDHALFGVDVARWLCDQVCSPALTAVMTFCYTSYYYSTAIYAGVLYFWGSGQAFRKFVLATTIAGFIGYTGYLVVPAVGPYLYQASIFPDQLPGAHSEIFNVIEMLKGHARDAFPSVHTAMTAVLMGRLWHDFRWLFWAYLPVGLGLFASTLYLRQHYAIDLVAGFAVAAIALYAAPRIERWWYPEPELPRSTG